MISGETPHGQFLSHPGRAQCSISVIETVWRKQNQTWYNTLGCIQNTHTESVSKYKLTSPSVHAMGPTFLSLLIANFETTCWIVSYCSWISWISWKWYPFSYYHSWKQEEITEGQIRTVRRVGEHSDVFSSQKLLQWQTSVHLYTDMVSRPVLVLPSLWIFLVNLHPQALQNLLVEMLDNCLTWRNKFLMKNIFTVKK
jgi:hypothetical protein